MAVRILVVEDEPGIADTICYALTSDGFELFRQRAGLTPAPVVLVLPR